MTLNLYSSLSTFYLLPASIDFLLHVFIECLGNSGDPDFCTPKQIKTYTIYKSRYIKALQKGKKLETIRFAINDNLAQLIDHKLQLGMMMIQYMSQLKIIAYLIDNSNCFTGVQTWADPEGGEGVQTPLENLSGYIVSLEILVLTPSRINWTPWVQLILEGSSYVPRSKKYVDDLTKKHCIQHPLREFSGSGKGSAIEDETHFFITIFIMT